MKKQILLFLSFVLIVLISCDEEPVGQTPIDSIAPGKVKDVQVENISGGAVLSYTLPNDEDLLYVKAEYFLRDTLRSEVKASLYTDTLKIKGFGDTQPRQVTLYAVDRSRNLSEGVSVTIEPLEPAVNTIANTLRTVQDFGGIHVYWDNPGREEVSVVILQEDENMEYVPLETFYSSVSEGDAAVRDLDTIPGNFRVILQDRWENRSVPLDTTLTPLYETQFDRLKMRDLFLPGDEPSAWGWVMRNIFDGIVGDQGFHTAQGTGRWPHSFTFDLGQMGQVSRIKMYQRQGQWIYTHGNPREFEVWGSETLDVSGSWDNWFLMMECSSTKPSELPMGQTSGEDAAWAAAGEEYINSPENPPVRYIRIKITENWSGGDFFHFSELEVFGDNRY